MSTLGGWSASRRGHAAAPATLLVLAVSTLVSGCASVSTGAERVPRQGATISVTGELMSPYVQRALYQPITGACRATLQPDRAVVVGSLSAAGVKPTETAAQLDRQLDALRELADEENVTLRLVERVRAARPVNARARTGQAQPYVVEQRVELETGLDADIDRLLERALQAGLDARGGGTGTHTSTAQPLVVYRFGAFDEELARIHHDCRAVAVRTWCEAQTTNDAAACVTALESPAVDLVTEQLTFTSQQVTRSDGSLSAVQVLWPHVSTAPIELGGDAELKFAGTIMLRGAEAIR